MRHLDGVPVLHWHGDVAELPPGAVLLASHPSVDARLRPEWLEELARRSGREVRREADSALAVEAPHAQVVPR